MSKILRSWTHASNYDHYFSHSGYMINNLPPSIEIFSQQMTIAITIYKIMKTMKNRADEE